MCNSTLHCVHAKQKSGPTSTHTNRAPLSEEFSLSYRSEPLMICSSACFAVVRCALFCTEICAVGTAAAVFVKQSH
jgi:hypothetical protein